MKQQDSVVKQRRAGRARAVAGDRMYRALKAMLAEAEQIARNSYKQAPFVNGGTFSDEIWKRAAYDHFLLAHNARKALAAWKKIR